MQVVGSLSLLATFLQTKGCMLLNIVIYCHYFLIMDSHRISELSELDESMLDALGILPQRKQHKKLLLVCALLI